MKDKGQPKQQSFILLYPVRVSGWDVGEEGGLEDEAALPHSTSLWSSQSPHSGLWGILILDLRELWSQAAVLMKKCSVL